MATLVSPGTSVSVTNEAFYGTAGPGTVPLIVVATAENKTDSSGTSIAEGTLAANANNLYLITSQRELLQTFGIPKFYSVGGTPRHGYPLNEYGLLAAHSYLGVSNRAFILRADIDLSELEASDSEPTADPADGTYWVDLADCVPGLFEYDGTAWVAADVSFYEGAIVEGAAQPASGFVNGDFVIAADTNGGFTLFERTAGVWNMLGSAAHAAATSKDFQFAKHTNVPSTKADGSTALASGDLWFKTTTPNAGASLTVYMFDADLGQFVEQDAPVFYDTTAAAYTGLGGTDVAEGVLIALYDSTDTPANAEGDYTLYRHNGETVVTVTGTVKNPTLTDLSPTATINGTAVAFAQNDTIDNIVLKINNAGISNIVASKNSLNQVVVKNTAGYDVTFSALSATFAADTGIAAGTYSNFIVLEVAASSYSASATQPTLPAADGRLWYSNEIHVDILENSGTGVWEEFAGTVHVQPAEPDAPASGDLWVDTDQLENYPVIYRYDGADWNLIDNTDQTTPDGIVFGDARINPEFGSDAGANNGDGAGDPDLDADRPDPLLYPAGMLLFNTRYSTLNVKKWVEDYTFDGTLIGDRWVTESGLKVDGSPYMGEEAVKKVITDAMAAVILNNDDILAETNFFNLIAAPGFTELLDEMITLNVNRKQTAFVVGDTPFTLKANGTAIQNWATNANGAASNGKDGLIAADEYLGVYYPSGLSTNVDGEEVVVPSSHMVLRTIALNDQKAYPWFAPAGEQRGMVTNAASVGYIDDEGEYVPVKVGEGLRDVLYTNNINPIAEIPNRGIMLYGQKTRSPSASALDRINVARLINFIRYQAEQISRPFLFQPNDPLTRSGIKNSFDRFLSELVTLRGLYDYLVVVDESNNTPSRIDRNEMWVDIAIQPTKTAEFIYVPIRVKNTDDDLSA